MMESVKSTTSKLHACNVLLKTSS